MEVVELYPRIFKVSTGSSRTLAMTFLRFQEYYESPMFRGKTFTLEEFKNWYAEQYGAFTYASDWAGFNIPSHVLDPFKRGDFGELSDLEVAFLRAFDTQVEPFYVIGTEDNDPSTLEHEMCHALFFVDSQYRKEALTLLDEYLDELSEVYAKMYSMGYHGDVVMDEVHAYVSANPDWLDKEGVKYARDLTDKLLKLKKNAMETL